MPYHRTEWTAQEIKASFSVDLRQLASYGLGEAATILLQSIALWEIRALLEDGLRLRTACDLMETVDLTELGLPELSALEKQIAETKAACSDDLGGGDPIAVRWISLKKSKA